jgi:hypothetical protein
VLDLDPVNYDIITCKIGSALNLGYIDDVFQCSEQLIKLSSQKPQVKINLKKIINTTITI